MLLQKTGMEQSKSASCALRKVVDGEVTLVVCVCVDDLVVTAKGKAAFNNFL